MSPGDRLVTRLHFSGALGEVLTYVLGVSDHDAAQTAEEAKCDPGGNYVSTG